MSKRTITLIVVLVAVIGIFLYALLRALLYASPVV